ncbi:MAG: RNA polymerase Rpb4 family protein [Thermoproteota archaeon]|jgi:DNA-directed RNA polymerase subunit F|nr:RNA polymerase Rpb4 family protein [Thermoproteota archaeon]
MKIIFYKDITMHEALEILEKRLAEENVKENQKKMYDYLKKFSSLSADKARALVEKLVTEFNVPRSDAVQMVNMMPSNVEELRNIIQSDRYYTTEELQKILKVLKE